MSNIKKLKFVCFALWTAITPLLAFSQDTSALKTLQAPEKYFAAVHKKVESFNNNSDQYTQKTLEKIIEEERKMQRKVAKVDPTKARLLFNYAIDSLKKFETAITSRVNKATHLLSGTYFPYLDTLKQSLAFFKKAKMTLDAGGTMQTQLDASINSVEQMESQLATIDKLNEFLKQRESLLQSQLNSFPGLASNLQNINKQAYYFQSQVTEYKETLRDPDKIEKLTVNELNKLPAFQKYMQQNSLLAGLFASPSSGTTGLAGLNSAPVVNGLPSRAALQQFIQKQSAASPDVIGKIQQQVTGAASGPATILKNKLNSLGGNGNADAPDFTPNTQHTKSFGKRLELGMNMQFGSSTNYLPASATFGLQAGYKLNDKSSFGIGASYGMGMGTGWNHIRLSNQSVGFRTYLKWKPRGTFYVQGGGEWNYLTPFSGIDQLRNYNAWQTSMLLGIGREYKINKKLNGNIQALYDFLYDRHFPVTQPIIFRVGYNL